MNGDIADSFHCLFQMIEDCIYIHDVNGRFIAVNKAVTKTYGCDESYFIGKTPADFAVPGYNDMEKIQRLWQKCVEGEAQRFEFWSHTHSGDIMPKELIINCGFYAGERVIIAVARDITQQKALEAKLRQYADRDSLTGLFNRRVFFDLAEKALSFSVRYRQSLSTLIIDIDHFKLINDSFGHPTGDQVLQWFANFCLNNARASDIVARIGGEEFAIVMPNTSLEQAMLWAEQFTHSLTKQIVNVDGQQISISASIGISTLDEQVSDIGKLISTADRALYEAKASGRDCYKVA